MDRNIRDLLPCGGVFVALRKESVDRNKALFAVVAASLAVALRKESVDRNC